MIAYLTLEQKHEYYNALKLEINLMIYHRAECECSDFWARNGNQMIPEIIDMAENKMLDPLEFLADFARDLHSRHLDDEVIFP